MMHNGEFIFLSEEAKEKVSAMTDSEITLLSTFIAHSMRETQMKIQEEARCKAALHREE
jgi:hypothetical protein